jgi:murein DD-endopeptidase MepM/ murein hydrolase activator NlpD
MTKKKSAHPGRSWRMFVVAVSFLAGMVTMSVLDQTGSNQAVPVMATSAPPRAQAAPVQAAPAPAPPLLPVIEANPIADLRGRHLDLPVQGAQSSDIKDMFNKMRGNDHRHEAVDILAPRLTPVLAVEAGTIAKLFVSKAGGNTIYQFDPQDVYAYYYAHLERYADGLVEGAPVARGQVIGYVGTTGNAPPNTPHLHFAIFKLTTEKQWWKGTALDPYQVLR